MMRKLMIVLLVDIYIEVISIINLWNVVFVFDLVIKVIIKLGGFLIVLLIVVVENVVFYVDLFDGFLLFGGFDVDFIFYG